MRHYDEKSCGTILFTKRDGEIYFLLLRTPSSSALGFPKGHVEPSESEQETALRETWEETSLRATIIDGWRRVVYYKLRHGRIKQVVYFLAYFDPNAEPRRNPGFERYEYLLLTHEKALPMLRFANARELLSHAKKHISAIKETLPI